LKAGEFAGKNQVIETFRSGIHKLNSIFNYLFAISRDKKRALEICTGGSKKFEVT
jgi:hypothetical protein